MVTELIAYDISKRLTINGSGKAQVFCVKNRNTEPKRIEMSN